MCLPDTITHIGGLECVQDFEQGRLVQGHRVVPLYRFLGGFLQSLTRWPVHRDQARRTDQDLHHRRDATDRLGSLIHEYVQVA